MVDPVFDNLFMDVSLQEQKRMVSLIRDTECTVKVEVNLSLTQNDLVM